MAHKISVMVVDDFEPWRRFVASALKNRSDLEIISEAVGGLEAVTKSAELRPDLILLDLGLPSLHGIEVARRILLARAQTKILIVCEDSSPDMVLAALE